MASDVIRIQDLLDNPDPHVPVCLCLDTSGSMLITEGGTPTGDYTEVDGKRYRVAIGGTTRLDTLQKGIQQFYDAIFEDENARYAAEISIVTFDDEARMVTDFSRVEYDDVRESIPNLDTHDRTALGAGVNLALDLLEKRKQEYKQKGVDYFQPWLVIMTDGENNGPATELERAKTRIHELVEQKKLSVFPFIIGTDEGIQTLAALSPRQKPMQIGITQIKGLFSWLGKSIAQVSSQSIGTAEPIQLSEFEVTAWDQPLD